MMIIGSVWTDSSNERLKSEHFITRWQNEVVAHKLHSLCLVINMKQVELLRTAASEQAYLCRNALQVMAVDWSCQRSSRMCTYSVTAAPIKMWQWKVNWCLCSLVYNDVCVPWNKKVTFKTNRRTNEHIYSAWTGKRRDRPSASPAGYSIPKIAEVRGCTYFPKNLGATLKF